MSRRPGHGEARQKTFAGKIHPNAGIEHLALSYHVATQEIDKLFGGYLPREVVSADEFIGLIFV
jgi:hypothetical protein